MTKITLSELEELISLGACPRISTPSGMERITDTYRKVGTGSSITFDDGSLINAADGHLVWYHDQWKPWKTLKVGDKICSKLITNITPLPSQSWIDFTVDADHESYFHNEILHHNSGKSAIIYTSLRWHLNHNRKCIIIVPSTSLVEQLYSDFEDYSSNNGFNVSDYCQKIYSGFTKDITFPVTISTWQSIHKQPKSWFKNFDVVYTDEAHLAKASSLVNIMEKMDETEFRVGTTGTLDESHVNKLTLEGLFGKMYQVTTTRQLMDQNSVADLKIKCVVLKYDDQTRKAFRGTEYQQELDWLVTHPARNKFIRNLAISTEGTTLVLFNFVNKHGKVLYEMIKTKVDDTRPVYFIHGGIDTKDREEIRNIVKHHDNAIIIASYGTLSTGTNIPSIKNVIFAHPSKSKVRNLQSIGRGLRLDDGKSHCMLFDICDDLKWKSWKNTTLNHAIERYKIYATEQFEMKIIEVDIQ